jgi:hypothetical protein
MLEMDVMRAKWKKEGRKLKMVCDGEYDEEERWLL